MHRYKLQGRSKRQNNLCLERFFYSSFIIKIYVYVRWSCFSWSQIWCKFLASNFASTIALYDVFSALARSLNTTAGRLKAFWLLADSSAEKQKPTRHQIHDHRARRDHISETGSHRNKWPSSRPAPFVVLLR